MQVSTDLPHTPKHDPSIGIQHISRRAGNATDKGNAIGKTGMIHGNTDNQVTKTAADTVAINKYLSIISKLENSVVKETIGDKELEAILEKLQARMERLDKKVRDKLFQTKTFKKLGITDLKKLSQELKTMLSQPKDRQTVFAFLKSETFIAALKDEPWPLPTYDRSALNGSKNSDASDSQASSLSEKIITEKMKVS